MPRLRATVLTIAVAVAVLAAGAAAAVAGVPLTPAQYEALDGALSAFVTLDRDDSLGAEALDDARGACRALDSADPLLNPLRKSCTAEVKAVAAIGAFEDCSGRTRCLRTARSVRMTMRAIESTGRAANTAVRAAGLVPACASALRTTRDELRLAARLGDLYRLVERVIRTGSRRLARRLPRSADRLDPLIAKTRSSARERRDFRAGCALSTA